MWPHIIHYTRDNTTSITLIKNFVSFNKDAFRYEVAHLSVIETGLEDNC